LNKIIPLIFLTLILLIPQYQADLNNVPNQGDEIQYWEIGYGIYSDGEYKREILESNIDENLKLELGYRRGEPVYPLLIAAVIKVLNLFEEVIISDCKSIDCSIFDEEVALLVFIAQAIKLIIVFKVYSLLKLKYSYIFSVALTLAILLMLPIEYKDLITIFLLLIGLDFYYKKIWLGIFILSFLPLSNAVFLYILPIAITIDFFYKKKSYKKLIITLTIILVPSIGWMSRNYISINEFSITGRGSEVLSIRAEYSTNSYEQIRAGYIYYTPGRPFFLNLVQSRLWNYVTETGSNVVYDRSNPQSSYKMAKNLTGVVGSKIENKNFASKSYIEKQQILNTISLDVIKENGIKHLLLSTVFGYRGMFPSINFDFIDFYSIPQFISSFIKEIFSILRLFFIPYSLMMATTNLINKKTSMHSVLLITLWGFFALLTHFIPRYSTYLLIPALFLIANINNEQL
jgi:hypothetical protein